MPIKYLRRVNRYPAQTGVFFDTFAAEAMVAVSPDSDLPWFSSITKEWHRPSGDNRLLDDGLLKYNVTTPKRCYDGDYLAILKKTLDELRPSKRLIPLTLGAAAKHADFPKTTSPGFPWVHQGYHSKGDVLASKDGTGHIHRAWDMIGKGTPWSLPDSMAFHRVVASEVTKTKVRPVWGYPVDVVLEEARFFLPLLAYLKDEVNVRDSFYGLGMETARSGHEHLARSFHQAGIKLSLSGDLSNFDARVPAWIIRDVFSLVSDWFDFSKVVDSEGKFWNVNVGQTCRRWKAMISYFVNTKVRSPSGLRIQKSSGVPSGSMWTNFIDTCVNAVQMRVSLYRVTSRLPAKDYYYGDDSQVFLSCDSISLDALAEELLRVFGAILSVEKTILTDNVENIHWLGYYYRPGGPRRPLTFIVASTFFPEREVDSPLESCARLLGQLYSCMDPHASVRFYDAVRYIMKCYCLTKDQLDDYVSSKPSKAFKYLATLGLEVSDIVLPDCFVDPFGDRYIPSVMARPCPRRFVPYRDANLPAFAFIPEAYQNRNLRQKLFKDFNLYTQTFSFYDEFDLDFPYFTD
nr:RNA-dependent RNA polymerase [Erysiphe necator associated partiti-like virus 1]